IHVILTIDASECLVLIKQYLEFDESYKDCQKIICKDGLISSNRDAYFQAVRKSKASVDFLCVNAPSNPHFNDWKTLIEEAYSTLQKIIEIELNNAPMCNWQKLLETTLEIEPDIPASQLNYINGNFVSNHSYKILILQQ
ncbi:hypothetical protein MXB_5185, partial [Myxobolus squamalis]